MTGVPAATIHPGVSFMPPEYARKLNGKLLALDAASHLASCRVVPVAGPAYSLPTIMARVLGRIFMAVFAMGPRLSGNAAARGGGPDLIKIDAAIGHNCIRKWHTIRKSLVKSVALHPDFPGPLRNGQRLAAMRHKTVDAPVVHLLHSTRPTAIVGAVWAVVVDALDRLSIFRLTHVSQKIGELAPLRGNRNTSSSVPIVMSASRVSAPLPHGQPSAIGWCSTRAVRPFPPRLGQASARSRNTRFERVSSDFANRSAGAFAKRFARIVGKSCHGPIAKLLADNINPRSGHRLISTSSNILPHFIGGSNSF